MARENFDSRWKEKTDFMHGKGFSNHVIGWRIGSSESGVQNYAKKGANYGGGEST